MAEKKKNKPKETKGGKKQEMAHDKKKKEMKASKAPAKEKKVMEATKPAGKKPVETKKAGKEPVGKPAEAKKSAAKETKKKKAPKVSKSKEVKKLSMLVRKKKRRMFRGRFGKRSVRKVSKEKWQKWRKPRGIDIYFKKEDGLVPGTGYRTPKKIRGLHPSGYREKLVRNMKDLAGMEKEKAVTAAKISSMIGKKKKIELLKKADELKIVVLNR